MSSVILTRNIIKVLAKFGCVFHLLEFFRRLYFESRYNRYRKKYNISHDFRFNGVDIELYGNGKIDIGQNSYVGNRSVLSTSVGCIIRIGSNCSISHNVRIYTSNRDPNDIISKSISVNILSGDVIIGDNVWIGANVFINQNITIGNNCVIGANSVVTKSIPSNSIAVGSPCKVIKRSNHD